MTKMVRYSALLASAAMLIAAPAMAQVRDLDRESSDVRVFQGSVDNAPAVFTVTVPARSVMVIDVLASGDLDPVLRVTDARTGELIGEDDDGGLPRDRAQLGCVVPGGGLVGRDHQPTRVMDTSNSARPIAARSGQDDTHRSRTDIAAE